MIKMNSLNNKTKKVTFALLKILLYIILYFNKIKIIIMKKIKIKILIPKI